METPRSVAIYARISSDPTGQALGVQRQLEDCRKLAAERGWTVGAEYVDNDVSAYSGKPRPEYELMMSDVRGGQRDAVIVYNMDRLTRRPVELEEFVQVCEVAGLRQVATVTADVDLGNDDGLFMARIFAAFAAKESGRKSERLRRKAQQNAEAGKPGGGAQRPFGYERDKITVNEVEAELIRQLVDRYLAGQSLRSLAVWLDTEGVPTTNGGEWRSGTVKQIIGSGRIAGLREHKGEVVGPAIWDAIITPEKRDQVLAKREQQKRSGQRAVRTHLLKSLLRCGSCGKPLYSSSRRDEKNYDRRYVCMSGPDHRGCGKVTVSAPPLEDLLTQAVLFRLDTPDLHDSLAGRKADDARLTTVRTQLENDRSQMDELATMWADREISREEWKTARDAIEPRIEQAERELGRHSATPTLAGLAGRGQELQRTWESLTLDEQRAIIDAVLDHAIISRAVKPGGKFNPERVEPVWAL